MWRQGVEAGLEEACNQPAKHTEITAMIAEERSGQLRQGEHILAVWHRREHLILQPLAVGEHALLMRAVLGAHLRAHYVRPNSLPANL